MLSRGSQRHEAYMIRNLTPGSQGFDRAIQSLAPAFRGGSPGGGAGFGLSNSSLGGAQSAMGQINGMLHRQSAMLAYLDIIEVLGVFCVLMIPLVLSIGKIKPAADGPAH